MNRKFQSVSVIGLGYIGLPTAAIIASRKVKVNGLDVNPNVVETINRGDIHIVEPMLDVIVRSTVKAGALKAHTQAVASDAFLIAVPTPIRDDKTSDISYVLSATAKIAPVLKKGDLVILESTSPVGTTEKLVELLKTKRPDLKFPSRNSEEEADIYVAYCPERVLPGNVVEELVANDRSIGGLTPYCTKRAIDLYRIFVKGDLIPTNVRSAELCKLAENAFRDVNIAFANEMANVCDHLDMNVWEVISLANRHPRVNILQPGPGVGGHCIAVDPWFIVESAPQQTPIIQACRNVNDNRPNMILDKIRQACEGLDETPTIALLGLAFKPNIDDLRGSPAIKVAKKIASRKLGHILAVEPNIDTLPQSLSKLGIKLFESVAAIEAADIIVLLVDHNEFKSLTLEQISHAKLIDTRGVFAKFR